MEDKTMLIILIENGKIYTYRSFQKIKKAGHNSSAYVLVFDKGRLIDEGKLDVFINI